MSLTSVNNNLKWYPVYTNARAEKKAFETLTAKGIEAYLPLQRKLKNWSDRKKWVEEPLIKSYLFVRIPADKHADVLMTKGIARFLYFSGKVASMPDKQIDELKLLMASSFELEVTEENLQPGEKVNVKAGPLKGISGEVVAYRSQKQLLIRLENLGQSILVNVPASLINRF